MTVAETSLDAPSSEQDTWTWWQARRLRYNLALAGAGWAAYAVFVAESYGFGHPVWLNAAGGLGMTLFLGTAYLLLMGVANVCYLAGPAVEAWVGPGNRSAYRRTAYAMGFWASLAVPFAFPLAQLAALLSSSR